MGSRSAPAVEIDVPAPGWGRFASGWSSRAPEEQSVWWRRRGRRECVDMLPAGVAPGGERYPGAATKYFDDLDVLAMGNQEDFANRTNSRIPQVTILVGHCVVVLSAAAM
jgi:hypothetical protein